MVRSIILFVAVLIVGLKSAAADTLSELRNELLAQKRADTTLFNRYAAMSLQAGKYTELIATYKMLLDSAKKDMAREDQALLSMLCERMDTVRLNEYTVYLYFITGRLYTRYHLDNTSAQNYFLKSIRFAERLNDPCLTIRGYSGLGSFYMNVRHDIVIANQYFEKIDSVLLARNMNGISECNVDVNQSHAMIYYYMGNYATGCAYLDKSIAIASRLHMPQKLFDLYIRRANFEIELGLRARAQRSLDTLEQIVKDERNGHDLVQLINSYRFNIAVQEERFEDAATLSRNIVTEELNGTNDEYFDYLFHLCKLNIHYKRYEAAEANADLYESTLKPWNIQRWRSVYQMRFLLNRARGNDRMALKYFELYTRLNDSVHHQQQIFAVIAEQIKYQTVQKEIEFNTRLGQVEQQSELRRLYLLAAIVVLGMTVALIIQFYISRRKDKRNITTLKELNSTVLLQKQELEEKNNEKDRIMDVVVHDLRSPVSGIAALANQLAETGEHEPADTSKMAGMINRAADNALQLINELMDYSHETGGGISIQPTDIVALVQDVVSLLLPMAQQKTQTVVVQASEPAITVPVDAAKMSRAINNLLTNAIKFSYEGGQTEISISRTASHVLLAIQDHGIGIPEAYQAAAFDMFTGLRRRGTGGERSHGLGLSITRQIVLLHGGRIWLQSNEGIGTTFYIELVL